MRKIVISRPETEEFLGVKKKSDAINMAKADALAAQNVSRRQLFQNALSTNKK